MADFVLVAGARLGAWAEVAPHPGATLVEPAVLVRPLDELPATYVGCRYDDGGPDDLDDADDVVRRLLAGGRWRLVEMDTGHWPMFSRPRELARILLDEVAV
ncbi:hypothetical protein AB0O28_09175 [Microbispora sp. NPDC088329]|uniref:hypothetical protein n=1 Tax=Microbispora sp. NPDC088329 TaxID=3154869 RepID=UPI00343D8430